MRILSRQDLTDILYGCAVLGTGGGGELDEGFEYIDAALEQKKEFRLISIDDVPAGKKLCTPYMLGAISELPEEEEKQYKRLSRSDEPSIMTAYNRLLKYSNTSYYGTICCELGGSNTAISFYVAAMSDGYIIDADPAGRAVPEITHSTFYLNKLPAAPIVTANEFGECFICENVIDDMRAEDVVRALAMVSRNDIAAIDHALDVEVLAHAVIKGTITKALEVGKALRLANELGRDIAVEIANHCKGFVAFRGVVSMAEFKTEAGFTVGEIIIDGSEDFVHSKYRITVKNENMAAWLDDEVQVTIPDLICLLDMDEGGPVTNPNPQIGMNVAVVILPAPKEFTTEKGLSVFGPSYIGLDMDYQPAVDSKRLAEASR